MNFLTILNILLLLLLLVVYSSTDARHLDFDVDVANLCAYARKQGSHYCASKPVFPMDSSSDEEDTLEEMRRSELGGASMNTHDEPPNEKFENSVRETIEFEEALGHLNMKKSLGNAGKKVGKGELNSYRSIDGKGSHEDGLKENRKK